MTTFSLGSLVGQRFIKVNKAIYDIPLRLWLYGLFLVIISCAKLTLFFFFTFYFLLVFLFLFSSLL